MSDRHVLREFFDTGSWRSTVALTLNLKQSIRTPLGASISVDELACKDAFKRFMQTLNRKVYRSAYRHHGKRLRVLAIVEKAADGRWHYHVAIEPPAHMTDGEFGKLAMELWQAMDLGYGHGDVCVGADEGWIAYMTKRRSKNGLEHYFDCIDTDAFYNPVASV